MKLTKPQSKALLRIWSHFEGDNGTFLSFRRTVQPTIGCDNAVVVYWQRMWLCIETDGYTHS
jgi:hypothetical protein